MSGWLVGGGRRRRLRLLRLRPFGFPATTSDGDVTENAAFGPVTTAVFTKVSRLREVVIVVVTELCVKRVATRTLERLVMVKDIVLMRSHPPISTSSAAADTSTVKPPCTSSAAAASGHGVIMNILHFQGRIRKTHNHVRVIIWEVSVEREREK